MPTSRRLIRELLPAVGAPVPGLGGLKAACHVLQRKGFVGRVGTLVYSHEELPV